MKTNPEDVAVVVSRQQLDGGIMQRGDITANRHSKPRPIAFFTVSSIKIIKYFFSGFARDVGAAISHIHLNKLIIAMQRNINVAVYARIAHRIID